MESLLGEPGLLSVSESLFFVRSWNSLRFLIFLTFLVGLSSGDVFSSLILSTLMPASPLGILVRR